MMQKKETESKSYYNSFFWSQDNVIIADSSKEIPSAFSN